MTPEIEAIKHVGHMVDGQLVCNDDCPSITHKNTPDTEWSPRNKTHGLSKGKFYRTYYGLRSRCLSKKAPNYAKYGGRGIGVEWKNFDEFHSDMYVSFKEHVATYGEKNTTIDRIDSTKNYSKENCRWATYEVQNNNRSYNRRVSINGKNQTVAEWCREMGLSRNTVDIRLSHYGWDIIRALTTPVL